MGLLPAGLNNFDGGLIGPVDYAKIFSVPNGAQIVAQYLSQVIDFTVAANGYMIVPELDGFYPIGVSISLLVTAAAGTQVSGPLLRAGSDPTHTNYIGLQGASGYSNTAHSQIVTNGTPFNTAIGSLVSAGGSPGESAPYAPSTAVFLDVATPASGTGGYILQGKFRMIFAMAQ